MDGNGTLASTAYDELAVEPGDRFEIPLTPEARTGGGLVLPEEIHSFGLAVDAIENEKGQVIPRNAGQDELPAAELPGPTGSAAQKPPAKKTETPKPELHRKTQ